LSIGTPRVLAAPSASILLASGEPKKKTRGQRLGHRIGRALRYLVPSTAPVAVSPHRAKDGLASLAQAPRGQWVRVVEIHGGPQRFRRLCAMGLYPDARVQVISAGSWGPVIVRSGETRLAIGRNVAQSVWVAVNRE
jgi:Fe2+ transport system protein FeoA